MVIDFSPLNSLLRNFMYKDEFSVQRLQTVIDPQTNITNESYTTVPGYESVPGKISLSKIDSATVPTSNSSSNPYSINPQLFYSTDINIEKGDKITVKIIGNKKEVLRVVTGIAGEPKSYQMFNQVELSVEEN